MQAWVFQERKQVAKLGNAAPWVVGWYAPDGKRKQKTIGPKSKAEAYARKIEGQLAAGTYQDNTHKTWKEFRKEYEEKILSRTKPGTKRCTLDAMNQFEKIIKPAKMRGIKTQTIDEFIAKRSKQRGAKKKSKISPATINKELRHLKAVLRKARKWKYLAEVPDFEMLREPSKLPRYVEPAHFAAIYGACDVAERPTGKRLQYSPADWWRALMVFCYMTGWRINEPLSARRSDVDLDAGTAITRHANNKGGRDELAPLHPIIVEHLQKIQSVEPLLFPWPHNERALWTEFHRIQKAAGIHLPCFEEHEHTDSCHYYGFHDLRRAFATMNADTLSADALQTLMRHKSYTTTQRYINVARQLNRAVADLHVPEILKKKGG
jgi:integrase